MSRFTFPTPTLIISAMAAIGLSACSTEDRYGYGGGLAIGYGNAGYHSPYDDYYGYYSSNPYWGWYGDYYYPGSGIYIYDRSRRAHRWNDQHRRYWTQRRDYWQGRGDRREDRRQFRDNWRDFQSDRRGDRRDFRNERRSDRRDLRRGAVSRDQYRQNRRGERRDYRQERRDDRRQLRRNNRGDRRD